jgi:hypothetical protein
VKVTIEVQYPDEKPKKYSYEDEVWDHDQEGVCEILTGLMKQMGFELNGKLGVMEKNE